MKVPLGIKLFFILGYLAIVSLFAPIFVAQTLKVMGEKMQ